MILKCRDCREGAGLGSHQFHNHLEAIHKIETIWLKITLDSRQLTTTMQDNNRMKTENLSKIRVTHLHRRSSSTTFRQQLNV